MQPNEQYWEVVAQFQFDEITYRGKWTKDGQSTIEQKKNAERLGKAVQGKPAILKEVIRETKEVPPSPFLTLAALQKTAKKSFKLSAAQVKQCCNSLYSKGLITSPVLITDAEAQSFPDVLGSLIRQDIYSPLLAEINRETLLDDIRYVNTKNGQKVIVPTPTDSTTVDLEEAERQVFDIILRSFIAAHYENCKVEHFTIVTYVNGQFRFETKGKRTVHDGWKSVFAALAKENTDDTLPSLTEGQMGTTTNTTITEGKVNVRNSSAVEQAPAEQEKEAANTPENHPESNLHIENSLGLCQMCGKPVVDKGKLYGCSAYSTTGCSFTVSKKIRGAAISEDNIKRLLDKGETGLIRGFVKQNKESSETYEAALFWDGSKIGWKFPNHNVYHLPLKLLNPLVDKKPNDNDTKQDFQKIEQECLSIKLPANVQSATHGPRVTRFELLPKSGINIAGYKRFKANLQAALFAEKISLHIPIPGTNLVGIEVPNRNPYPVQIRSLLENKEYLVYKKDLSFPIGLDLQGSPIFGDLSSMPHLLVAGTTGSGKSVFLNTLIISLLYGASPDNLKMMFIDPKMVEFSVYENLPNLFTPIVTDVNKAGRALQLLVREMEQRYTVFKEAGVRNIQAYNEKILAEDANAQKMPYIVLLVDELADLLMMTDVSVEELIQRLAQLARAAGIHMVIATQRPTRQVLSPTIKSNLPVRIAFSVPATSDSMTILDQEGAQDLLGKGDMLYQAKDGPRVRLQSAYVSDEEIKKVINHLRINQSISV